MSASGPLGLELSAGAEAEAYIAESLLDEVMREHALEPASRAEANLCLRVVPDLAHELIEHEPIAAAAALDLAESPDSRSARVGRQLLAELDRELRQDRSV